MNSKKPHKIKKYAVRHPLLKRHIKFFWEIHADHIHLNHAIVPVRNIDLKFNLNETTHYAIKNSIKHKLEDVYFSGLQDRFGNAHIHVHGKVDTLGICFYPDGLFPFFKIPLSECKNQLLGTDDIGFKKANNLKNQLIDAPDVSERLHILESELVSLLDERHNPPDYFQKLFIELQNCDNVQQIYQFCKTNQISIRKLERLYNKYVGISPRSYNLLNRFQSGMNQLLFTDYSKLSDIAYDNGYFDQTHFIKEFKRFAGNTPKNFKNQNNSMIQVGKFTELN